MPSSDVRVPWYEKTGVVIACLIIFWPLGLALIWVQRKFTPETRLAVSVAAPVLTLLVAAGIIFGAPTSPPSSSPQSLADASDQPPSQTSTTTSSPTTASTTPTSSKPATKTTSPKTGSKPKIRIVTSDSTQPPTNNTGRPGTSGQPLKTAPPATKAGSANARFSMTGTAMPVAQGGQVKYTLKADGASGIVEWVWWVSAGGQTAQYSGQSVSGSYVGDAPYSVSLTTRDRNGNSYYSEAPVYVLTGNRIVASAK